MEKLWRFRDAGGDYDVPESELAEFRKSAPEAAPVHLFRDAGGDYDVPEGELGDFRKAAPDAAPVERFRSASGETYDVPDGELGDFRRYVFRSKEGAEEFARDREELERRKRELRSFWPDWAKTAGTFATEIGRHAEHKAGMALAGAAEFVGDVYDAIGTGLGGNRTAAGRYVRSGAEGWRGAASDYRTRNYDRVWDERRGRWVVDDERALDDPANRILDSVVESVPRAWLVAMTGGKIGLQGLAANLFTGLLYGNGRAVEVLRTAKETGLSDEKSYALSGAAGAIEGLLEMIGDKFGLGGAVRELRPGFRALRSEMLRHVGREMGAESATEFIQEAGGNIIDQLAAGTPWWKLDWKQAGKAGLEAAAAATLSVGATQAGNVMSAERVTRIAEDMRKEAESAGRILEVLDALDAEEAKADEEAAQQGATTENTGGAGDVQAETGAAEEGGGEAEGRGRGVEGVPGGEAPAAGEAGGEEAGAPGEAPLAPEAPAAPAVPQDAAGALALTPEQAVAASAAKAEAENAPTPAERALLPQPQAPEAVATTENTEATPEAEPQSESPEERESLEYRQRYGNTISGDNARQMLGADPARPETHAAYSRDVARIVENQFSELLERLRGGATPQEVVFLGGGNGAGKSTVAAMFGDAAGILDSTMSDHDSTADKINRVIDAGGRPLLAFVWRNPADAWRGVQDRMSEGGHGVTEASFRRSHERSRETFLSLLREFGDKIDYVIFENDGRGAPREISAEELAAKPGLEQGVDYGQRGEEGISAAAENGIPGEVLGARPGEPAQGPGEVGAAQGGPEGLAQEPAPEGIHEGLPPGAEEWLLPPEEARAVAAGLGDRAGEYVLFREGTPLSVVEAVVRSGRKAARVKSEDEDNWARPPAPEAPAFSLDGGTMEEIEAEAGRGENRPESATGGASKVSRPHMVSPATNDRWGAMPGRTPADGNSISKGLKSRKKAENALGDYAGQAGIEKRKLVGDLVRALGLKHNRPSLYRTFVADDGSLFSVRLSNHRANAANYKGRGADRNLSIAVIRARTGEFEAADDVVLKEFEYSEKDLTAKDCKDIALALRDALRSGGDYRDPTGKAKVNESPAPRPLPLTQDPPPEGAGAEGEVAGVAGETGSGGVAPPQGMAPEAQPPAPETPEPPAGGTPGDMPEGPRGGPMEKPESRLDRFRRKIQDAMLPVKRLMDEFGAAPDDDVYLAAAARYGKDEHQTRELFRTEVSPVLDECARLGLRTSSLSAYLMARFAPERNRMVADRTAGVKSAGSGLSAAAARSILKHYRKTGEAARLEAVAEMVWRMNRDTLGRLVESGLLSRAQADKWMELSPHYVPLRTMLDEEDGGGGVSAAITRLESKHALGRTTLADNPLVFSILQAEQAVVRANKNEVRRKLAAFVRAHPECGFVLEGRPKRESLVDGTVRWVEDLSFREKAGPGDVGGRDNVVQFKEGGDLKYVVLYGERGALVARAVTGSGMAGLPGKIGETATRVGRYVANTRTSWSPTFLLRNLFYDVQAVAATMNMDGLHRPSALCAKFVGSGAAYRAAAAYFADGSAAGELGPYMAEAAENGMLVKGGTSQGWDETTRFIEGRLREKASEGGRGLPVRAARMVRGLVARLGRVNSAVEVQTRLAVYAALRKPAEEGGAGWGVAESVAYARDVTVDFNRKGELGQFVNNWWMFANASIQDVERTIRSFRGDEARRHGSKDGAWKSRAATIAALAALGVVQGLDWGGGDDNDDGEAGDVTEYAKQTSWRKRLGKNSRHYLRLGRRGPYGLIPYAAEKMTEVVFGRTSADDAASDIAEFAWGLALDPVSGGGQIMRGRDGRSIDVADTALNALAPWFGVPLVQAATDRDFTGAPLTRKRYNENLPASWNGRESTASPYKAVARFVNRATGGDKFTPGRLDLPPEYYALIVNTLVGGLGSDAARAAGTVQDLAAGEFAPERIPFVRDFVREVPDNTRRYWEARARQGGYETAARGWRADGDAARAAEVEARHPSAEKFAARRLRAIEKEIGELREKERTQTGAEAESTRTQRLAKQREYIEAVGD